MVLRVFLCVFVNILVETLWLSVKSYIKSETNTTDKYTDYYTVYVLKSARANFNALSKYDHSVCLHLIAKWIIYPVLWINAVYNYSV